MKDASEYPTKKQIAATLALYDSGAFLRDSTYTGNDLGATCTKEKTSFLVWSPLAEAVSLCLYEGEEGACRAETDPGRRDPDIAAAFAARNPLTPAAAPTAHNPSNPVTAPTACIPLKKSLHGVWRLDIPESLHGARYTYLVTIDGITRETTDPYARACCANGARSVVVDLSRTNPDGWEDDRGPALAKPTDAILYELHIRDLSMDASSGIAQKGRFLGLAQTGTHNTAGLSTGLDHIRELGVTHVHLLPCFDYGSVDELAPAFNWGYDPANYNIPEGSYSSNPDDATARIREMKTMVQALHTAGLGVVMDVVYNHTATTDSHFQRLAPYYYYRIRPDGSFANGSACGNEIATQRPMARNFLVQSVAYWAKEYHIDGFRFDLMGLHDIPAMQAIRARLDEINPQLLMYGEGWTGGDTPLPETMRATKKNIALLPGVAAFNDNLRDAVKGGVFDAKEKGFVTGRKKLCEEIRFGICGCTPHPQIHFDQIRSADAFWASSPAQCVNYVSAHDNLTLWDKLACSYPSGSKALRTRMNKLAAAIYMTAQGIPFFQAGEEFLRSKPAADGTGFEENSYRSPDKVNALKWDELTKHRDVYEYYRGLIAFRKAHPALRMDSAAKVASHLFFLQKIPQNTVGFLLHGHADGDALEEICVLFNPNRTAVQFELPDADWAIYADGERSGAAPFGSVKGAAATVSPVACLILGH